MRLLNFIKENRYFTDKIDLGYIHKIYNIIVQDNREQFLNVLEIGIHDGESMKLWRDFFINANIVGIDLASSSKFYNKNRINEIYGNAYSPNIFSKLENINFDLMIDDGPHTLDTMKFFIEYYIPLLNKNGYGVIEDIIDTSWSKILINYIDTAIYDYSIIDMRDHIINPWHKNKWKNGLDVIVIKKK